jgi:hypothetical protein
MPRVRSHSSTSARWSDSPRVAKRSREAVNDCTASFLRPLLAMIVPRTRKASAFSQTYPWVSAI